MVRLTRLLARTEPSQPLANRLIAALAPTLGMDGGAITIGYDPPIAPRSPSRTRSPSGSRSCRTCCGRAPASTPSARIARWPRTPRARAPLAVALQSLSERPRGDPLFAVPMMHRRALLGVISMYRRTGARLDFDGTARSSSPTPSGSRSWAVSSGPNRPTSCGPPGTASTRRPGWSWPSSGSPRRRVGPAPAHAFAHGVTLADVPRVVTRRLDFRDTATRGCPEPVSVRLTSGAAVLGRQTPISVSRGRAR